MKYTPIISASICGILLTGCASKPEVKEPPVYRQVITVVHVYPDGYSYATHKFSNEKKKLPEVKDTTPDMPPKVEVKKDNNQKPRTSKTTYPTYRQRMLQSTGKRVATGKYIDKKIDEKLED